MSFMSNLKETINNGQFNESYTENGALGYRTTGKALIDINFAVASMRSMDEDEIIQKWEKAYFEDKLYGLTWLFFASDVRGGLGERRLFRIIFRHVVKTEPELAKAFLKLIPEYSRWDNIFAALHVSDEFDSTIIKFVENQLNEDMENMKENKSISLLAK